METALEVSTSTGSTQAAEAAGPGLKHPPSEAEAPLIAQRATTAGTGGPEPQVVDNQASGAPTDGAARGGPASAAEAPDSDQTMAGTGVGGCSGPEPQDAQRAASGAGRAARQGGAAATGKRSPRRGRAGSKPGRGGGRRGKEGKEGKDGKGKSRSAAKGPLRGNLVEGPILRENKTMFSYGNYDQYYSKRFDRYATVDPRIDQLLTSKGASFFTEKAVLDLGCNAGFVTLLVAALGASKVEGVDIDLTLVSRALKHLRWLKKGGHTTLPTAPSGTSGGIHYPACFVQSRGIVPYGRKPLLLGSSAPEGLAPPPSGGSSPAAGQASPAAAKGGEWTAMSVPRKAAEAKGQSTRSAFPYNVEFRAENVLVSDIEERRGSTFDVILCLKLTKWVQLHWGDAGIKVLFHKCFQLLRPGGFLVLEAQEWQSYLNASKHLPKQVSQSRSQIQMRPEGFTTYLVDVIGFQQPKTVGVCPPLKRPLLLLRKPDPGFAAREAAAAKAAIIAAASAPPRVAAPTPATATTLAPPRSAVQLPSAAVARAQDGPGERRGLPTAPVAPMGLLPPWPRMGASPALLGPRLLPSMTGPGLGTSPHHMGMQSQAAAAGFACMLPGTATTPLGLDRSPRHLGTITVPSSVPRPATTPHPPHPLPPPHSPHPHGTIGGSPPPPPPPIMSSWHGAAPPSVVSKAAGPCSGGAAELARGCILGERPQLPSFGAAAAAVVQREAVTSSTSPTPGLPVTSSTLPAPGSRADAQPMPATLPLPPQGGSATAEAEATAAASAPADDVSHSTQLEPDTSVDPTSGSSSHLQAENTQGAAVEAPALKRPRTS